MENILDYGTRSSKKCSPKCLELGSNKLCYDSSFGFDGRKTIRHGRSGSYDYSSLKKRVPSAKVILSESFIFTLFVLFPWNWSSYSVFLNVLISLLLCILAGFEKSLLL